MLQICMLVVSRKRFVSTQVGWTKFENGLADQCVQLFYPAPFASEIQPFRSTHHPHTHTFTHSFQNRQTRIYPVLFPVAFVLRNIFPESGASLSCESSFSQTCSINAFEKCKSPRMYLSKLALFFFHCEDLVCEKRIYMWFSMSLPTLAPCPV